MATTIPALGALLGREAPWDLLPPIAMTAAQRTAAVTAINAGTIVTQADALALVVTAAVAPVTQKQIYDLIFSGNVPVVG